MAKIGHKGVTFELDVSINSSVLFKAESTPLVKY